MEHKTLSITAAMAKKLGSRAAAYVTENSVTATSGKVLLVADMYGMPKGVERTLNRVLGRSATVDRGETAYWEIRLGSGAEVD